MEVQQSELDRASDEIVTETRKKKDDKETATENEKEETNDGVAERSNCQHGGVQQHAAGGGSNALAKLDALSRDDLIKLAKKQLMLLKDTRKQLASVKKESEGYAIQLREFSAKMSADSSPGKRGGMIAMELNDYKSALVAARKELAENVTKMGENEALVEEFSQRVDQLQQQKEEIISELRTKIAQNVELTQKGEATGLLLSEHVKEVEAMQLQLNDARQSAQREMSAWQNEQRQLQADLANIRRIADARGAEVRRLRADSEMNVQLLAGIREEFSAYKERAECALAKYKEGAAAGTANSSNGGNAFSEFQQLIDALSARNVQVAELGAKCSFLEEELRSGQLHSKTLLEELNSLHDQQQTQRQQWASEKQRIVAEHAERMRAEETLRTELRRELQATREREAAAVSQQMERLNGNKQQQTEMEEQRKECDRLLRELEEAKVLLKCSASSSKCLPTLPLRPNKLTTKHLSRPPPLILGHQTQQFITTATDSLEMDAEDDGDGLLGTTHSESSDSLDDLHSVLQEAIDGAIPRSDIPASFNVASLAEHFGEAKSVVEFASNVPANWQQFFVSRDQHQGVLKLLEDCRELLSDTEEDNVRLSEQVSVLKEEIRRMERCMKRVEHLGNGVCPEYFKNIVLKFLSPPKVHDERVQLLPVLQTILHLNSNELEQIRRNCTVPTKIDGTRESEDGDEEEEAADGQHKETEGDDGGWAAWIGWKRSDE